MSTRTRTATAVITTPSPTSPTSALITAVFAAFATIAAIFAPAAACDPAQSGTFTDSRDNKAYKWVKVDGRTWMAENLNYTQAAGKGASYCYDDKAANCAKYGRLYTVEAVKGGVCPAGYRMPTAADWDVLYRNSGYDDGFTTVGRELRAAGLGTWDYAKGVAGIDMYGFSALPGGYRSSDACYNDGQEVTSYGCKGGFGGVGEYGIWWRADGHYRGMYHYATGDNWSEIDNGKGAGFSVRCVKEEEAAAKGLDYSSAFRTHFGKGTLGASGKSRPIEMFFQSVSKNCDAYYVSGKSKTSAAEDAFAGTLSVSRSGAGGSCGAGESELTGSYDLKERESKTSGRFVGSFTACEKNGKLSKANFSGNWVKDANGNKTPCDFELSGSDVTGGAGSVTDARDGQSYRTVKIGSQTWTAQNMNYKTSNSQCHSNDEANCKKYGRLYDESAAKAACPKGWHLPSDAEWYILVGAAGGAAAGKKLKSKTGWKNFNDKNGNGTDDYGFAALPGSGRDGESFYETGMNGIWWSTTMTLGYSEDSNYALGRNISFSSDGVGSRILDHVSEGASVRCVRD